MPGAALDFPAPPRTPLPPDDSGGGGDGGRPDRPTRWVTLAVFLHPAEAHIARLRLESAGVACVLLDEMMAGTSCLSLAVGGVKLQVPLDRRDEAAALLRRMCPDSVPPEPPTCLAPDRRTAVMAACVAEAAGATCNVAEATGAWAVTIPTRTEVPAAAAAVARSPFAETLTPFAVRSLSAQACPTCGAARSRPDLRAALRTGPPRRSAAPDPPARRPRLPRLRGRGGRFGRRAEARSAGCVSGS